MTTTDDRPNAEPEVDETTAKRLLAGRQIVAKLLAEEIAADAAATREALEGQIRPRETVIGTLPDGIEIGQVGRSKPRKTAKVTDHAQLLAWVKANRPEEIVEDIRPSYLEALKNQAKTHGHAFDPTTGEVIPGVEEFEGSSSYTPRVDEGARELVMPRLIELINRGLLPALAPPQES